MAALRNLNLWHLYAPIDRANISSGNGLSPVLPVRMVSCELTPIILIIKNICSIWRKLMKFIEFVVWFYPILFVFFYVLYTWRNKISPDELLSRLLVQSCEEWHMMLDVYFCIFLGEVNGVWVTWFQYVWILKKTIKLIYIYIYIQSEGASIGMIIWNMDTQIYHKKS